MDIRDMRREKHRRAYVSRVDEEGEIDIRSFPVEHWAVLSVVRRGERVQVWQPAFRYGGSWAVPKFWADTWPDRALIVADPGELPDEARLVRAARALLRSKVEFVPQPYTDEDRAEQIAAAEAAARHRAYPPTPPAPASDSEGWWEPASEADLNVFAALTECLFEWDCCVRSERSGPSGRLLKDSATRKPTGNPGTTGTTREITRKFVRPVHGSLHKILPKKTPTDPHPDAKSSPPWWKCSSASGWA